METISSWKSHGGTQSVLRHASTACRCDMVLSVFLPPAAEVGPVPVLWYLSGLTCTHQNATEKAEYRKAAADAGIMVVCPDTSPRGPGVPDEEGYDIGQGAGFYVDATEPPFADNYRMRSYVLSELPALLAERFPADLDRQAITGHSMGGHGALVLALSTPGRFRSVSAFAPIVAPSEVPWGRKAFSRYLGEDRAAWRRNDAVALIEDGARVDGILVDQGEADVFLADELRPERLEEAAAAAGIPLNVRRHPGYDHSYYFISTFMADHVAWHAARLAA